MQFSPESTRRCRRHPDHNRQPTRRMPQRGTQRPADRSSPQNTTAGYCSATPSHSVEYCSKSDASAAMCQWCDSLDDPAVAALRVPSVGRDSARASKVSCVRRSWERNSTCLNMAASCLLHHPKAGVAAAARYCSRRFVGACYVQLAARGRGLVLA